MSTTDFRARVERVLSLLRAIGEALLTSGVEAVGGAPWADPRDPAEMALLFHVGHLASNILNEDKNSRAPFMTHTEFLASVPELLVPPSVNL